MQDHDMHSSRSSPFLGDGTATQMFGHMEGNTFTSACVYLSQNRSNAPGLNHPGFSVDTRGAGRTVAANFAHGDQAMRYEQKIAFELQKFDHSQFGSDEMFNDTENINPRKAQSKRRSQANKLRYHRRRAEFEQKLRARGKFFQNHRDRLSFGKGDARVAQRLSSGTGKRVVLGDLPCEDHIFTQHTYSYADEVSGEDTNSAHISYAEPGTGYQNHFNSTHTESSSQEAQANRFEHHSSSFALRDERQFQSEMDYQHDESTFAQGGISNTHQMSRRFNQLIHSTDPVNAYGATILKSTRYRSNSMRMTPPDATRQRSNNAHRFDRSITQGPLLNLIPPTPLSQGTNTVSGHSGQASYFEGAAWDHPPTEEMYNPYGAIHTGPVNRLYGYGYPMNTPSAPTSEFQSTNSDEVFESAYELGPDSVAAQSRAENDAFRRAGPDSPAFGDHNDDHAAQYAAQEFGGATYVGYAINGDGYREESREASPDVWSPYGPAMWSGGGHLNQITVASRSSSDISHLASRRFGGASNSREYFALGIKRPYSAEQRPY
jgi:hypothetical protein